MLAPGLRQSRRVGSWSTFATSSGSLRRREALRVGSRTSTARPRSSSRSSLMVGARLSPEVRYPVSELAAPYGASVEEETSDTEQARDFFHSPPWTEHAFVGAGDGRCVIPMRMLRGSGRSGRRIGRACPGARPVRDRRRGSFRNTGPGEGSCASRRRILEEDEPVAVDVADYEPPRSLPAGLLCEYELVLPKPLLMGA